MQMNRLNKTLLQPQLNLLLKKKLMLFRTRKQISMLLIILQTKENKMTFLINLLMILVLLRKITLIPHNFLDGVMSGTQHLLLLQQQRPLRLFPILSLMIIGDSRLQLSKIIKLNKLDGKIVNGVLQIQILNNQIKANHRSNSNSNSLLNHHKSIQINLLRDPKIREIKNNKRNMIRVLRVMQAVAIKELGSMLLLQTILVFTYLLRLWS